MGVVVWYLFIFLLGLVTYPITRSAFAGLRQYAYPLSRIVGILLLAWISWMGGSIGVPYTQDQHRCRIRFDRAGRLRVVVFRSDQFKAEWNSSRKFFVMVEVVFLVFFLIDLLIRLGNSDMWHPAQRRRETDGLFVFQRGLEEHQLPAV